MATIRTVNPISGREQELRFDAWLMISALFLLGFGLSSLYSQGHYTGSEAFFKKQLFYIVLGVVPAAVFAFTDPHIWKRAAPILYGLNCLTLLAVLVVGKHINGSERWIDLGPVQFQPSEMAKLLTVLTLSAYYSNNADRITEARVFFTGLGHIAIPMVLILKQPHFGAATVIFVIWISVSLAARIPWKYIAGTLVAIVAVVGLALYLPQRVNLFHDYHEKRLQAFVGNAAQTGSKGILYQTERAKIAFGVGGVVGAGFDKGTQGSYIPEQETDFIFTVPGEELGLIGCTLLLVGYAALFLRISLFSITTRDDFYRMVSSGIVGLLAFHTFVNLAMVTQLIPVIGLWLPFMSYGGTAIWLCMSAIALVLNMRSRDVGQLF